MINVKDSIVCFLAEARMLRAVIRAPKGEVLKFKSMDTIHDAAVAMLTAAGAPSELLIGEKAGLWGAGAAYCRKSRYHNDLLISSTVIISTADAQITQYLARSRPENMQSRRAGSGEMVDLSGWQAEPDGAPVAPGTSFIKTICATPIAITRKGRRDKGKWHFDVREFDLSAAVNTRLTRLSGRQVALKVEPDIDYVEARKSHAVFSKVKADKGNGVVVGLKVPLTLSGSEEDLELAWYAGLGEKTRIGFGIISEPMA